MKKFKVVKISAHNLVPKDAGDLRFVAIASGFDNQVLVVEEDAFGNYSVNRVSVKKFEKEFGVKLTKEKSKTKN